MEDDDFTEAKLRAGIRLNDTLMAMALDFADGEQDRAASILHTAGDMILGGRRPDMGR